MSFWAGVCMTMFAGCLCTSLAHHVTSSCRTPYHRSPADAYVAGWLELAGLVCALPLCADERALLRDRPAVKRRMAGLAAGERAGSRPCRTHSSKPAGAELVATLKVELPSGGSH